MVQVDSGFWVSRAVSRKSEKTQYRNPVFFGRFLDAGDKLVKAVDKPEKISS